MTKYAKKYCSDVEFSAEDASRSDRQFLKRVFEGVIRAGATTINVPDTVGYASPAEMADLIRWLSLIHISPQCGKWQKSQMSPCLARCPM